MASYPKPVGIGKLPEPGYLHFTNRSRDEVCRCMVHWRHPVWHAVQDPVIYDLAYRHFEKTDSQQCTKEEWRAMLKEVKSSPAIAESFGSFNTQVVSPPELAMGASKRSKAKSKRDKPSKREMLVPESANLQSPRQALIGDPTPSQSDTKFRVLHFTEEPTTHVCRCKHPILQHGNLYPVRIGSVVHEAASIYFDRFGGLTCFKVECERLRVFEDTPPAQETRPADARKLAQAQLADRMEDKAARSLPEATLSSHQNAGPFASSTDHSRLPIRMAPDEIATHKQAAQGNTHRQLVTETTCTAPTDMATSQPVATASQNPFNIKTKEGHSAMACPEISKRKRVSTLFIPNVVEQKVPRPKEFWKHHIIVCSPQDPPRAGAACKICRLHFPLSLDKRTLRLNMCRHHFHEECLIKHFRTEDQDVGTCPTCFKPLFERTPTDRLVCDKKAIFGNKNTEIGFEMKVEYPDNEHYVPVKTEEQLGAIQLRVLKDNVADALDKEWTARSLDGKVPNWDEVVRAALLTFREVDCMPRQYCRYMPDEDVFLTFVCWAELTRIVNKAKCAHSRIPEFGKHSFPPLNLLHRKFWDSKEQYLAAKRDWKMDSKDILPCEYIARDVNELCMASFPAN